MARNAHRRRRTEGAASEGIDVVDPATEEVIESVPRGGAADVDAAVQAAHNGLRRVAEDRRRGACDPAAQGDRADRARPQGPHDVARARAGQAGHRGRRRDPSPDARPQLLRRPRDQGARLLPAAAFCSEQGLRHGPAAPDGRRGRDRPEQLPAHAAGHQARAGADGGQHDRGQARGHDAADDAEDRRPAARGRVPGRRRERDHGQGLRGRRRARHARPRAPRRLHRLHRRRPPHHGPGRAEAEADDDGAGRLRPRHRRPRRQHQGRRARDRDRPLLELRPDVPRRQAHLRLRRGLRRADGAAAAHRRQVRARPGLGEGREAEHPRRPAAHRRGPHGDRRAAAGRARRRRRAGARRRRGRGQGLLRAADDRRQPRRGLARRARGDVRAGAARLAGVARWTRRSSAPTTPSTASAPRCGPTTSAPSTAWPTRSTPG